MVSRDFAVIPSSALNGSVSSFYPVGKLSRLDLAKVAQYLRYIFALVEGQIFTIGAGIGRQFPFIELLCRIEDLLRAIAVAFPRQDLQSRER